MKIIVAVDKHWGIGKDNDLLFNLPLDMKHFKEQTLGKAVVMGSNTLRSLPQGKPLKNRVNIVLSTKDLNAGDEGCLDADRQGLICAKTLDELLAVLKNYPDDGLYVIGGASVYKQMLPYCDEAVVTKVDADGGAEAFFPDLDEADSWVLTNESEPTKDGEYYIKFCRYQNKERIR